MPLTLLYKGPAARGECWQTAMAKALPEVNWLTWPDVPDDSAVDGIITWTLPENALSRFTNLKAIFSVGAGVDQFSPASLSSDIKLVRMVDPAIAQQMKTYVAYAVLMLHRQHLDYAQEQQRKTWSPLPVALPHECTVGILGLGNLGNEVATMLSGLGFTVRGWSRSAKNLPKITTFHGEESLPAFLSGCHVLVCLLPLTEQTRGILNHDTLSALPAGASLINTGRGGPLVEKDLLALLDNGHLNYAVLDVFEQEPLPESHPFWAHPKIHITPHIASSTSNDTAALQLVANIKRWLNDEAMEGEVDCRQGY